MPSLAGSQQYAAQGKEARCHDAIVSDHADDPTTAGAAPRALCAAVGRLPLVQLGRLGVGDRCSRFELRERESSTGGPSSSWIGVGPPRLCSCVSAAVAARPEFRRGSPLFSRRLSWGRTTEARQGRLVDSRGPEVTHPGERRRAALVDATSGPTLASAVLLAPLNPPDVTPTYATASATSGRCSISRRVGC